MFFGFPLVSLIPVLGREKLMLSEVNIGILASSEGLGALIAPYSLEIFRHKNIYL